MDLQLKKIKDIQSECCVTILLKTHRTRPENEKDSIRLRNQIVEMESRLEENYDPHTAKSLVKKAQSLADSIDHSKNLEGMAIFINEDLAEVVRFPIAPETRVIIDNNFFTRPLVRALHQQAAYYLLVLDRRKARLIEAANGQVVKELEGAFPYENETLFSTDKHELSMNQGTDRLIEEFFNRIDKEVMKVIHQHPLPLVICTEERNYHHYRKVADKNETIIGHLNKNRMEEKSHQIAKDAWPIVSSYVKERNNARIEELKTALGSGHYYSDFNDIWRALNMGRGRTLFIEEGYYQAAIIEDGQLKLVEEPKNGDPGVIDDIIDEMIDINLKFGGENVFLPEGTLDDFQGLALVTRY